MKDLLAILEADARATCAYVSNDTPTRPTYTQRDKSLVLSVFFFSPGICQHAVLPSKKCALPACRWSIRSTTEGWGFLIEIGNVNRRLGYSAISQSPFVCVEITLCRDVACWAKHDITRAVFESAPNITPRSIIFSCHCRIVRPLNSAFP